MKEFQNKMKTVVQKHRPDREALRLSVKNRLASDGTDAVPCARFPEWLHGLGVVAVAFAFVVGIIVGSALISGQREPVVTGEPTTTDEKYPPDEMECGFDTIIPVFDEGSRYLPMEGGTTGAELLQDVLDGKIWHSIEETGLPERLGVSVEEILSSAENITSEAFYAATECQLFDSYHNSVMLLLTKSELILLGSGHVIPYEQTVVRDESHNGFIYYSALNTGMFYGFVEYFDFETKQTTPLLVTYPLLDKMVTMASQYDYALRIHKGDGAGDMSIEVLAHDSKERPWTETHRLTYLAAGNSWTVEEKEKYCEKDTFREEDAVSLTISAEPVSPDSFTTTDVQELLSRLESYPLKRYPMFDTRGGILGGKINYTLTVQYRDGSTQTVTLAPGFLYTDTEIYGVDKEQYEDFCAYFGDEIVFEPRVTEIRVWWDSPNEQRINVTDPVMVAELCGLIKELEERNLVGDGPRFFDRCLTVYTADNRSRTLYLYADNLYAWSDDVDENGGRRIYTADLSGLYAYLYHAFPQLDSPGLDSGE